MDFSSILKLISLFTVFMYVHGVVVYKVVEDRSNRNSENSGDPVLGMKTDDLSFEVLLEMREALDKVIKMRKIDEANEIAQQRGDENAVHDGNENVKSNNKNHRNILEQSQMESRDIERDD
jgi:hypothetical protein